MILDFLKNNFVSIFVIIFVIVLFCVFKIQILNLEKENEALKEQIEKNDKIIEDLSFKTSKLETILKEKEKQRELEDYLIEKEKEKELEIENNKDVFINTVNELKDGDDEIKNWCEQPLPDDISSLLYDRMR